MPPKRASSASKKAKTSNEAATTTTNTVSLSDADVIYESNSTNSPSDVPKSKRWAAVSGSGNADYRYRVQMKDPEVAYSFICICRLPGYDEDEDDDDDEDEEDNEDDSNASSEKEPCDGGDTCLCDKPVAEHPEHTLVISKAGNSKYFTQRALLLLRCPDMFDMYVENDFEAYGVMEVIENLVLDWVEAGTKKNWKEQWVIVEAMAMMWAGDSIDPMQMADDSERVQALFCLILRMVLTTISNLEHMGLLKSEPEVKSLGFIMALYIANFDAWRDVLVEETPKGRKFKPEKFDAYLLAYAQKYDVPLKGPRNLDDVVDDIETDDIKLPSCELKDPWGWTKALSEYRKEHGYNKYIIVMRTKSLGGDRYDITTWTPKERAEHSFSKKDPLGKTELDALEQGLILEIEAA